MAEYSSSRKHGGGYHDADHCRDCQVYGYDDRYDRKHDSRKRDGRNCKRDGRKHGGYDAGYSGYDNHRGYDGGHDGGGYGGSYGGYRKDHCSKDCRKDHRCQSKDCRTVPPKCRRNKKHCLTIIHNARIITMNDDSPKANWLIYKCGRIVKVGKGCPPKIKDSAKWIDAGRRIVIPGIQDQHLHWMRQALNPGFELNDGENSFTQAALLKALKKKAATVPAGKFITLIGRHNHLQYLKDPKDPLSGDYPTQEELDVCAPNHPVVFLQRFEPFVSTTGPIKDRFNNPVFSGAGMFNTRAMNFFNAKVGTAVPQILTLGVIYEGSINNNFIGTSDENKLIPTTNEVTRPGRIPNWDQTTTNFSNPFGLGQTGQQVYVWFRQNTTFEQHLGAIKRLLKWSYRVGLVGVSDAGGFGFNQITDNVPFVEVDQKKELKFRIRYQLATRGAPGCGSSTTNDGLDPLRNIIGVVPQFDIVASTCPPPLEINQSGFQLSRVGSPFYKNNGIGEGFPRGANQEHAARMLLRRPDWKISNHAEHNQITPAIADFIVADTDPCAIGSIGSRHWSLEHLNCATQANFTDMARVGLGAGIQAVRFMFPDWQFEGPPYALAENTPGLIVGYGADGMHAAHGNPWITMQFMVTGEIYNGLQLLAEDSRGDQRISLFQGLRGYTKTSAWFTREEDERGQIKKGYLADIVILNQNPFKVCQRKIRTTESVLTIVGGCIVYDPCHLG